MKILLLEHINHYAIAAFQKKGYIVESIDHALSEKELGERINDISLLGIRSQTQVTAEVLAHAKKLLAIGVFSVGINHIDLSAATKNGIAVRSEEHTSELQSPDHLVCLLLLEKKKTYLYTIR